MHYVSVKAEALKCQCQKYFPKIILTQFPPVFLTGTCSHAPLPALEKSNVYELPDVWAQRWPTPQSLALTQTDTHKDTH